MIPQSCRRAPPRSHRNGYPLHRLEENIAAAAVELTTDDLENIESAVSAIAVQGERYSPQHQARIDR